MFNERRRNWSRTLKGMFVSWVKGCVKLQKLSDYMVDFAEEMVKYVA